MDFITKSESPYFEVNLVSKKKLFILYYTTRLKKISDLALESISQALQASTHLEHINLEFPL